MLHWVRLTEWAVETKWWYIRTTCVTKSTRIKLLRFQFEDYLPIFR